MGKPSTKATNSRLLWQGPLLLILVVGLIVFAMDMTSSGSGKGAATSTSSPQSILPTATPIAGVPSGLTPEPWYYDPATNKHWHAGHGHWHDGPPPPPDQRVEAPAMTPSTITQSTSMQPTITTSTPNRPATTPASGEPDSYGRLPGDPHYGHNHP